MGKRNQTQSVVRTQCKRLFGLAVLLTASYLIAAGPQSSIFSVVPSPNPSKQGDTFNAGTVISPGDVWAVGYKGANEPYNGAQTLTERFDGTAWTVVPSPNTNPAHCNYPDNNLTAVSGTTTNDVWAVGFNSSCGSVNPLALHWNGTHWGVVPSPKLNGSNNNQFSGVFALASNNVYAVGWQAASNGGSLTLVEHFDGNKWSVVSTPNVNKTGNYLNAVFGSSTNDIWAVGDSVAPNSPVQTIVEHFNGVKWSIIPSPNPLTGPSDQNVLTAVTATSPSDVTAVGFILSAAQLNVETLVEHWDGTKWTVVPSANGSSASNTVNKLLGVSALSPTNVYAVGWFIDDASLGQEFSMVEHFDGSYWTLIPNPVTGVAQNLNAVFAAHNGSDVWITGAFTNDTTDPETGLLVNPQSYVLFTASGGN
jgi:hypothetical protein